MTRTGELAGHRVARVGYGAMQLAEMPWRPAVARDTAITVLRGAVQLGVNHIDTAAFYGAGTSNELIRAALAPYPDDLVLVTKVGAEHTDAGLVAAQRPEQLRAAVEENLRGLGVERVDVVNLRRLDQGPGITATGDQVVDLDAQLAELAALRDEGKIGAIGLSGVHAGSLRRALPAGIVCVQNEYSLLARADEPLLDLCRAHGIAWVPFFPLGSGVPGRPTVSARPEVIATASRIGATPAQVGLAWLLAHDPAVLLIPGTASVEHLRENVAVPGVGLDAEAMALLDGLSYRVDIR